MKTIYLTRRHNIIGIYEYNVTWNERENEIDGMCNRHDVLHLIILQYTAACAEF